ncbi:MAG: hypothetical protein ACFFCS_27260 [Candidatus Hodarchaeota archaeon]
MQFQKSIKALDFLKGFSLTLVIVAHLRIYWNNGQWKSAGMLIYMIFGPLGPAVFILCSMVGLILSLSRGAENGKLKNNLTRILKRALVFLAIGAIINLILIWDLFPDPNIPWFYKILGTIFVWNIITFMGVAQIILYLIRKLKIKYQIVGVILVFIFYYIMILVIIQECNRLDINYQTDGIHPEQAMKSWAIIIYMLLFFNNSMAPFMPWLGLIFLANIVYTKFADAWNKRKEIAVKKEIREIRYISLIIMLTGMVIGFYLTKGEFSTLGYQILIADGTVWNESWGGFPMFLHGNTVPFVLFSFGLSSFILINLIAGMDLHGRRYKGMSILIRFGKYSLTVFLVHAVAALIPVRVSLPMFPLAYAGFLSLFLIAFNAWEIKLKGKGSLEWFIRYYLDLDVLKYINNKLSKKEDVYKFKND